jgi:hypothetical protein
MMEQLDFFETLCPTCPVCNQSFKKTTHNKKYCCGTCREIKEKEKYKYSEYLFCSVCKKNFTKTNRRFKKYCSQLCYKEKNKHRNRLMTELRNILFMVDNPKDETVFNLTGIKSKDFLKKHLEQQFKEGMTWENYGTMGWHIDHINPCSSFDLTLQEERKKCFHYTNLQPLWWWENTSKGNRII